jgi:uncharacterized protein (DUF58 family)
MNADAAARHERQRAGLHRPAGGTRLLSRGEALAAALPPLLVAAERVAATVSQGVHGRRRVGDGETFWQFRRYQPGDSAQQIDWRQSAKTDRVYVRENEWEAAQSVWLWRDGSASMRWRSSRDRPTKLDRADLLLLALASLLARGGEHIALLGQSGPPSPGRSALRRLAAALDCVDAPGASLPEAKPLPRYGRLVFFSDLLSPIEEIQKIVTGFARRGVRGHLMQILDPAEETLPFSGRVLFEGSEHEGQVLFGRVETVRDEYRRALELHRSRLSDLARSASWTLLTHRTDHPPEAALLSLYVALAGLGRV